MDTQSPSSGSRSIIKVRCAENADPAQNRLELRTDPPTYIYLQPGLNILPVELYPGLCYGFSPAPDEDGELGVDKNCSDILEFDLSDFDASHLPSMDHMFGWMKRVQRITFGKMATPMLENTEGAFYRTGDDGKMEMLDLSRMDFSKVTNADWMFHGIKTSGVNLTNADFSNLTQAEGMFDECEIDHLILDNAKFPTEMLEDIFIELPRYFDIKKISLKGWGKAEIKVAIESIENNLDNTDTAASGIQYELDHDLEYSLVKTNECVVTCLITDMSEIFISRSKFAIRPPFEVTRDAFLDGPFSKPDFNAFLHTELKNSGIELEMDYIGEGRDLPKIHRNFSSIYSSKEFPAAFIKLSGIAWENHIKRHPERKGTEYEPSFIVGNHYFALTNNKKYSFYVPDLKQGYETINDVLAALDEVYKGDISHVRILHTEYLDMEHLPTVIRCNGKVWSPYQEPGFDMTNAVNKERFGNLIRTRAEQRDAQTQTLLELISKADHNRRVVCRDLNGTHLLINAAEILAISPKVVDSQKTSAEIRLRDHISIEVDLEMFAEAFVDHESNKFSVLPESLHEEQKFMIYIKQPVDDAVYSAIWNDAANKYRDSTSDKK